MKLVSYEINGVPSYGVLSGQGVIDLRRTLADAPGDLKGLLGRPDWIAATQAAIHGQTPHHALDALTLLPVIPHPGKIWCCGLNYGGHVRETGRAVSDKPTFFLRVADSQVAHGQAIRRPRESERLDYEGEIAVVIGKPGRRIAEADAWGHIAGYACYNDGSVRDWQKHGAQWDPGKNFWRTGGFGPWLVSADEIAAGQVMTLTTRLNGQVMQHATTEQMLHSIPAQIAYLSTIAPLTPGDVIVTGTPEGVGAVRQPPVWMKAGDVLEVEIDCIGVLRHTVVDD
jgi:2-keto-4-pentenoate hydratase/2-oxohepta-3-ene-1,7-dioic acid hydratase in catechol pathway